jgi:hypothetical membrane protein
MTDAHTSTKDNRVRTNILLTAGIIAGPIYILVGIIEILTRPGFDMTRHDLSLMSNGDWGWVHILLLVTTGLLTIAGAFGLRSVIKGEKGSTWGPLMLGLYGLGLVGAGIFSADPANGFPVGTPEGMAAITTSGLLHFLSGAIGFIGLIAACFILAKYFRTKSEQSWAIYSRVTGILFGVAFVGIAMGSNGTGAVLTTVVLAFTAAVILGWTWISVVLTKFRKATD